MPAATRFFAWLMPTLALLAACAPSGGSEMNVSGDYQTLASTEAGTSALGGVVMKLSALPSGNTITSSSGTLNHATGATTLDDGTYTLVDPDGYAANGILSDGTSTLISTPAQGFRGNYDFARAYTQAYFVSNVPHITTGIYGVVTRPTDMPRSGSAVYSGEAQASYFDNSKTFDLSDGDAHVTANFANGTVDVTTGGFTITERDSKAAADIGFNGIKISKMLITGNQFSGGDIVTLNNGATVQIISNVTNESALGRFFGQNSANLPDEVGGIGYLKGSDGTLTTIFLAD